VGAFDRNSNETQKFLEASRRSKSITAFTHDPELAAQRGLAFPGVTSFKKVLPCHDYAIFDHFMYF
jgi:hypothetical protein